MEDVHTPTGRKTELWRRFVAMPGTHTMGRIFGGPYVNLAVSNPTVVGTVTTAQAAPLALRGRGREGAPSRRYTGHILPIGASLLLSRRNSPPRKLTNHSLPGNRATGAYRPIPPAPGSCFATISTRALSRFFSAGWGSPVVGGRMAVKRCEECDCRIEDGEESPEYSLACRECGLRIEAKLRYEINKWSDGVERRQEREFAERLRSVLKFGVGGTTLLKLREAFSARVSKKR